MSEKILRWLIQTVFGILVLAPAVAAGTRPVLSPSEPLAALPMTFVAHHGQLDGPVRFHARGLEGQVFFADREVVFFLPADVLRLRFLGAQDTGEVSSGKPLSGTFNAFLGNDPKRWSQGLPTYDGVVYRRLYEGIDLSYNGSAGTLKGTYTVAAGADPGAIEWRYEGASGLRIDAAGGDLHITLKSGAEVIEKAPVAWQVIAGQRRSVEVDFVIRESDAVGLRTSSYLPEHPLVIDPTLVYSTYVGDSGQDEAYSVAVDQNGFIYVTGQTDSANFPVANAWQPQQMNASPEAFVFKLDPNTQTLVYSTYLGGDDWELGRAIAVDDQGAAYLTGETGSVNFPVTGHLQGSSGGGFRDAFVAKLEAGGGLVFSTYLGGSSADIGTGIAFDRRNDLVVVAGNTDSGDFPVVDAWQSWAAGYFDFFLTWLDRDGNVIVRSTYFGASGVDYAYDVAVDPFGDVVVVGQTDSSNLPTLNAAFPFYSGDRDGVVAKFEAGGGLVYSTYLGGSGHDSAEGVAVDQHGEALVTGVTESTGFPLAANPVQSTLAGAQDAFVTRFEPSGGPLYSTFLGGNAWDHGTAIAVDVVGNAYVTGLTTSSNWPLVDPLKSSVDNIDTFVAVLDAAGSSHLFSTYFGGSDGDLGFDIAVFGDSAYLTGFTGSIDLPLAQPWQGVHGGSSDAFVSIVDTGVLDCREMLSPAAIPAAQVIDFDALSNFLVIESSYQASHGVTFENSSVTRAKIYGNEPAKAHSPDNVATNDASPGHTSSNVPMLIEFAPSKTHVGMWIGNGGTAAPTAVLRAYDAAGGLLCQSLRTGVPEALTLFIGLHDPTGRIAVVELDYGATWLNESIDDLTFVP